MSVKLLLWTYYCNLKYLIVGVITCTEIGPNEA